MVDDFLIQQQSSYLGNQDDDFYDENIENVEYTDDDWQWEERLRLINEFSNWTSGDDGLDRFIQQTQLETPDPRYHMQWIPFDNFSDIKFVAKGGHSSVFSATWLNKTDQVWDGAKQAFVEKPLVVALKSLKNSQELSEEFLDEFKRHGSLKLDGCGYIVHCHGVTRHPETQEYMMVMNYAEDSDLRHYVQKNMSSLRWKDAVEMLCNIAMGLLNVHKNGTFHKNLHCGNILKFYSCNIADFGLCGPSNSSEPRGVYGSLPFIAPEVLAGGSFTEKADIYSFAFIMWELSSGRPPFSDRPHDHSLALEICHGFREAIVPGTPLFYEKLMLKCWNADPSMRPDAEEIVDILLSPYDYQRNLLGLDDFEINDFDDVDLFEQTLASNIFHTKYPVIPDIHPFAFYNSRFLLFPNLPSPRNSFSVADPPITMSYLDFNDNSLQSDDEEEITYEDIESDNESENEQYIPPPPPISMLRRKSLAPIPLAIN
ncbi:44351_t:CDS:2 [Gigaspora margarita]|uniref:44351_t:CDS:1 n=1 Tax=Gigaspora margarita TaxID=4874 RepID=A0ABN7ULA7_GIGMA|nr:44351_t:CDS:2 [Gigaspora margarita]